ncbi:MULTISPECIES: hypothetical protein [unclassified Nocardia]|uniref:AMIN-like domain-containing (lipo)protein n=1 Tax=unclassified Nocardia TaxID=2637762 RepID=UPI001CE408C4|nr:MULTISPECIES: hypothetical protein [unclassified Nocardia]
MRYRMVLTLAATAALLAGCGGGSNTDAPKSTTAAAAAGAATPVAPLKDAQLKETKPANGAALTVTDIGIEHHEGFDRVVFALGGDGAPGWRIGYADKAVQDGSGKTVDVPGKSVLEVRILGSANPPDSKVAAYTGPNPTSDSSAPGITGVYESAVFEGTTQLFIGLNGAKPNFSAGPQSNPSRLVVDIAA